MDDDVRPGAVDSLPMIPAREKRLVHVHGAGAETGEKIFLECEGGGFVQRHRAGGDALFAAATPALQLWAAHLELGLHAAVFPDVADV